MRTSDVLVVVGTAFGGVLLAVVLLFALMGGYMLGLMFIGLALLAMPVIGLVVGIRHLVEQPAELAVEPTKEALGPTGEPAVVTETGAALAEALPSAITAPVRVRVVEAHGVCPLGYAFHVGDEFTFYDGTTTPSLCPRATHALKPLVEQLRAGHYPPSALPYCQTNHHLVVFELQKKEIAAPVP